MNSITLTNFDMEMQDYIMEMFYCTYRHGNIKTPHTNIKVGGHFRN